MTLKTLHLTKGVEGLSKTMASVSGVRSLKERGESLERMAEVAKAFSAGEILQSIGKRGSLDALGKTMTEVSEATGKIIPFLGEIAPAVLTIGSLAAIVEALFKSLIKIDELKTKWSMGYGGDVRVFNDLFTRMENLKFETYMTTENLLDMTEAFNKAGVEMSGAGHASDDFIKVGAQLNRVLGISNDEMALYVRHMVEQGKTAKDVHDSFDMSYQLMQEMTLNLQQLNVALADGENLWEKYAYRSGGSVDKFQRDVISAQGLLKAFDIDIKTTKGLMDGMFGDDKELRREAMFVARMQGMSGRAAYNMALLHPDQFMKQQMSADLKYMQRAPGANFGKTNDQIEAMGEAGAYGTLSARRFQMERLSRIGGGNRDFLNQLQANWRSHGAPGNIDSWMDSQLEEKTKSKVWGDLDSATRMKNASILETGKNFSEAIMTPIERIAFKVSGIFDNVHEIAEHFGIHIPEPTSAAHGMAAAASAMVIDPMKSSLGWLDHSAQLYRAEVRAGRGLGLWPQPPASSRMLTPMLGDALNYSPAMLAQLDSYRKAQHMGANRKVSAEAINTGSAIAEEAIKAGADPITALAVMLQESSGRHDAHGDFGYFALNRKGNMQFFADNPKHPSNPASHYASHGPMQLHERLGKGAGLTVAEMQDPHIAGARAVAEMATLGHKHPNWSRGRVAAASQRPADQAGYASSIDSLVPLAQQMYQVIQEMNKHIAEDKNNKKRFHEDAQRMSMRNDANMSEHQNFIHHGVI